MGLKLNWKVLNNMLLGEAETDDITVQCKEEINNFIQTHDFDVFSEESLKELAGIFELSMKPAYEEITGTKIPNIFYRLSVEPEEKEEMINA